MPSLAKMPSLFEMGIFKMPFLVKVPPLFMLPPAARGRARTGERGIQGGEAARRRPVAAREAGPALNNGHPPRLASTVGTAPTARCHATSCSLA